MRLPSIDQWRRVDGMISLSKGTQREVADLLKSLNVLACLERENETDTTVRLPENIRMSVMEKDGQVAGYDDGISLKPVISLKDFATKLAEEFDAKIIIGKYDIDKFDYSDGFFTFDEKKVEELENMTAEEQSYTTNCVVITKTPSSLFPFLSNIENTVLGVAELGNDCRAVLHSANGAIDMEIVESCDTPYLAFYQENGIYSFVYMPTDDYSDSISYSWDEKVDLIYGKCEHPSNEMIKVVEDVLSPYNIATVIAGIAEEIDATRVAKALKLSGEEGSALLMREFGVNEQICDFFTGYLELEQVESIVMYKPKGYANAMEESFDIQEPTGFWSKYYDLSVNRPWVLNLIAGGVGFIGTLMLARSITRHKRNWRTVMTGIFGVLFMLEAGAEYMLNKYVGVHEEIRRRDNNDW